MKRARPIAIPPFRHSPRLRLAAQLATALLLPAWACAQGVHQPADFKISPQSLDSALVQFSDQSGVQLVVTADVVRGRSTQGVEGRFEPVAAMTVLLQGSGLHYSVINPRSLAIRAVPSTGATLPPQDAPGDAGALRVAQSEPSASSAEPAALEHRTELEEVIVTAGKRGTQLLQDIPTSITVINQDRIERSGMDDFLDYVRSVPGLGFNLTSPAGGRDDIRGGRRMNLRGIEGGFDGNPTTAFYLDEAPIPIMDPKLFDVDRVEVLRGPQGTLYGANSMGGAIRVIMNKPVQGQVQYAADATLSATHLGEDNTSLNGMLNLPLLQDRVALRAVAFYRNEGGFIDHVRAIGPGGEIADVDRDVNSEESWGARLAVSIQPTPNLRITPSVFHQEVRVDATGRYEPDFRDLAYFFQRPFLDGQKNPFTLSNLEMVYSPREGLELVSSTSYFDSSFDSIEDLTKGNFGYYGDVYGNYRALQALENTRFIQEARLSYAASRLNGVVGVFYMKDERDFVQADDSSTFGNLFNYLQSNEDRQIAVFGEATLDVTPRFSATAGARWFRGKQDQQTRFTIFDGGEVFEDFFAGGASGSAISPKLQLAYRVGEDKLLYTSVARGFRPGGPTSLVPATPLCIADLARLGISEPRSEFDPDTLWNYEAGTKSTFADGRLTANAAVYYIDWKDSQQSVSLNCGYTFVGNVGQAESKGFELELAAAPIEGLSLSGALGYTDAQFSETSTEVGVEAGDRFPQVPQWTGSASAQYAFLAFGGREAFVRGDYQYVDSVLEGNVEVLERPAFDTLNLRFGVSLAESTELTLFVDNVFDERGNLSTLEYLVGPDVGGLGLIPNEFIREKVTMRPRTLGLTVRFRR